MIRRGATQRPSGCSQAVFGANGLDAVHFRVPPWEGGGGVGGGVGGDSERGQRTALTAEGRKVRI